MDIKLMVAIIALVGVGASAFIQYYLGRQRERNNNTLEVQTEAYLDLINVVSGIAGSSKHSKARTLEELQKLTQAKSRVVLIGSDKVVRETHAFFTKFKRLDDKEACTAFSRVVSAMRLDLIGSNTLPDKILFESLFGKGDL